MAALAMILAAGMAVGNGPKVASGEMERGLDLSGEWEGTLDSAGEPTWNVWLRDGVLALEDRKNGQELRMPVRFVDDGGGRLRLEMGPKPRFLPGIFRQENDRVVIAFHATGLKGEQKAVLVLQRVKPAT